MGPAMNNAAPGKRLSRVIWSIPPAGANVPPHNGAPEMPIDSLIPDTIGNGIARIARLAPDPIALCGPP
ncbi:hypothetical protein KU6B_26660 [Mameliella alba]|nr:hypothetical protein KU6B_26660 [Mameliella alba]